MKIVKKRKNFGKRLKFARKNISVKTVKNQKKTEKTRKNQKKTEKIKKL